MTKERKATSDVYLSDDMSHVGELPRGLDFLETNAHLVMGESQGYDLCLLPLFYHVGNMEYVCRPPYWEIKGEHMGVTCDLTLGGMGNSFRCYGPWSDLAKTTKAGYEQRCWLKAR